jgi:hypothetical protein
MAAAQVLPSLEASSFDLSQRSEGQQAIDSVLGTMGAEGELPSAATIALMHRYVDGHMTMTELAETIFANARG